MRFSRNQIIGGLLVLLLIWVVILARMLAIVGPTASGKSTLGIEVALQINGEIINCDSTAVYRGFDIGTDKVPFDQRRGIPHHLIDIADPTDEYTAAQFARDAAAAVQDIHARGKLPILVGDRKSVV